MANQKNGSSKGMGQLMFSAFGPVGNRISQDRYELIKVAQRVLQESSLKLKTEDCVDYLGKLK